jgi:phage shock protein C
MENRRLTRCDSDRMVAGVCSGLGRYLNIDPTIVRLIFVLMFLLGGHGLLVYIILWIVMPSEDRPQAVVEVNTSDQN